MRRPARARARESATLRARDGASAHASPRPSSTSTPEKAAALDPTTPEWRVAEPALVLAASPDAGSLCGGSVVALRGEHLGRRVLFGARVVDARFVSTALVFVESPAGEFLGDVAVRDGATITTMETATAAEASFASFAYRETIVARAVRPARVTVRGGASAVVSIVGGGAPSWRHAACKIGTVGPVAAAPADATDDDAAAFACLLPAGRRAERAFSRRRGRDATWSEAPAPLTYVAHPRVDVVSPSVALVGVPVAVTLRGAGLSDASCASAPRVAGDEYRLGFVLRCVSTSFPGASAFVAIRVTDPTAGDTLDFFARETSSFARVSAPRVVAAVPRVGGGEGGAVTHLVGARFDSPASAGALLCVFSRDADRAGATEFASSATLASSAVARCETPPLAPIVGIGGGEVSVALALGETTASTRATYASAPTPWITAAAPFDGAAEGGTVVVVAVGGAVERSIAEDAKRPIRFRFRFGSGSDASARAAGACGFGVVGPVATRAASRGGEVECVSPAGAATRVVPLRVAFRDGFHAPSSPRATGSPVREFAYLPAKRAESIFVAIPASTRVVGWGLVAPRARVARVRLRRRRQSVTRQGVTRQGVARRRVARAWGRRVRDDISRARHFARQSAGRRPRACVAPGGAAGFVAVSVAGAESIRGVDIVASRDVAPIVSSISPFAVDAAAGGVTRVFGANLRVASAVGAN